MQSFPCRLHRHRLIRAALTGALAAITLLGSALAGADGARPLAGLLMLAGLGLGWRARRWSRLAARAATGARSEHEVQAVLRCLRAEGWQLRHSLPWPGHGDIDCVATAPTGLTFVVEVKTARYDQAHLARTRQAAGWLDHRHRRYATSVIPVLCVVRARRLETTVDGVVVVSVERLTAALRTRAGTTPRPAFLTPAQPSPALTPPQRAGSAIAYQAPHASPAPGEPRLGS